MKVCTFQPFPQNVVNAKLKQTIVENQGIRSPTPTGFVMDILLNCGGSCFIIVSYQTFCPPLQGKCSDMVFKTSDISVCPTTLHIHWTSP